MAFIAELNEAIEFDLEGFKRFISKKLELDNEYLEQCFWAEDGSQITVLNHLLHKHEEKKDNELQPGSDLTQQISHVLANMRNKNNGEPLHAAIASGKIQLALYLLERAVFNVEQRNVEGRTLLSLALATRNSDLLSKILKNNPNIYAITYVVAAGAQYEPLHEAVVLDFAPGIQLLGDAKAQLANPVGALKETPLLLAARLGKIPALTALLKFPIDKLNLEAENVSANSKNSYTAIEMLCKLLEKDSSNKKLLRGIAMLLCCSAEPPRSNKMCQLLANKRGDLLKAVDRYLKANPELVEPFVERCHQPNNALHKIIYEDSSFLNSLRQLLGWTNPTAVLVEKLVTDKHPETEAKLTGKESPLILYAEFVRRYEEAYANQLFPNPWSTMRWTVSEGRGTWADVVSYAKKHPEKRTAFIYKNMLEPVVEKTVHQNLNTELVLVPLHA